MELATRAFDQLAAKRGQLLEANLRKVAELANEPLAIARQPQGKWMPTDPIICALRIRDRNHHRKVHETGEDANAMDLAHSKRLLAKLREEFPNIEFVPDEAAAWIHQLLLPEDTEGAGWVALSLVENNGEARYLGSRSHILRRIPRRFQVARIFADIGRDDDAILHKIRSFALDEFRRLGGQS
jgi:hypothetical protein